MVKAVSAGALLFAAALPAAVATSAGAATAPSLSNVSTGTGGTAITPTTVGTFQITTTAGGTTGLLQSVGAGTSATLTAGTSYTITDAAAHMTGTAGQSVTYVASATPGLTINTTGFNITVPNTSTAGTDPVTITTTIGATAVTATGTGTFTLAGTIGTAATTLSAVGVSATATVPAGSIVAGAGIPTGDYIVSGTSAVTTAGVAETLAEAPTTGFVSGEAVTISTPGTPTFGAGGLPNGETIYVQGTGFAADGGNASITSSNPDLVFTSVTEVNSTLLTATMSTKAATTTGYASITLTDNNGTSAALPNAVLVTAAPVVTAISPTSVANGQAVTVSISGSGFDTAGDTVSFTNTTDGTSLKVGTVTSTATTASVLVTAVNGYNNALPASVGTYTLTFTNQDGGTVTTAPIFSVTAAGISNVSPSDIPVSKATSVTISGAGFQPNATVSFACAGGATGVASNTVVVSPSTITTTVTTGASTGLCNVSVQNPSTSLGGNGALFTATGGLGIGVAATTAATITGATVTPSTPIVVGSTATTPVTMTLTGTGFGSSSTVQFVYGSTNTVDANVTGTCTAATSGTTMTCAISVASGSYAGVHGVQVITGGVASNTFANALTVAGPVITAASPSTVALTASVGTVINLTGTGFNSTAVATSHTLLTGTFAVTSPTTATYALTTTPSATGTASIAIQETVASGVVVNSQPFTLSVTASPTVATSYIASSTANPLPTSAYVGAGAVGVPVVITGTGFQTGASIGSFVNAYGVADAGVTATVKSVNTGGTAITALVTIAAGDANLSDGYTITNPDGGFVKVPGFGAASLIINAGPTIATVTPATVTANSTDAFTITGTGFVGSSVSPTANGTCGPTTVVSSTTLTVSCTFSAATATAVSLVVKNADGGQATSAVVMAAASVTPPPVKPGVNLHTTGAHGYAVVGRTVVITITGGGFYGQPKLTSTAAGVNAVVVKDNGKMLTVRVTVRAGAARGWHTFTIRLANGKMAKVNYLTK